MKISTLIMRNRREKQETNHGCTRIDTDNKDKSVFIRVNQWLFLWVAGLARFGMFVTFALLFTMCLPLRAGNLASNGGCEETGQNGLPAGWQRGIDPEKEKPFQAYKPYAVEGLVKQIKGVSHGGEHSIGYQSKYYGKDKAQLKPEDWFDFSSWEKNTLLGKSETCAVVLLSPFFPFESGKKYRVALWTKGANASGLMIHIAAYNEKKECLSAYGYWLKVPNQTSAFKSGTWDWEEWSAEIKVGGEQTRWARAFAWYQEWGDDQAFYLDDLSVEEIQ